MKRTVLFICTHNAARSQMAEGLVNHLLGERYEAYSCGTEPGTVNPYVVTVMGELGIDLTTHRVKSVTEYASRQFDYVVTLCDHARDTCPFFPGETILHQPFEDPARFTGRNDAVLAQVRRVRDAIRAWIIATFDQPDA